VDDTKAARTARARRGNEELPERKPAPGKVFLKWFGIMALVLFGIAGGAAMYANAKFLGAKSFPEIFIAPFNTASSLRDPRKYFPGQDRITILCLGLDRNIFHSKKDPKLNGMPYTKGSRSDVMMIASLDLVNQTVSIISVPRDTRVQLPGKRSYSKINQAHADGGIPYTQKAVEEFLGVPIDHHVVIKQEAIQKLVEALGGITVDVPMDMDYDDNWGQLHIHLKEGKGQHLNGEQIVGFMRYRHGDPQGDLGRIKRQQQVIQVLSQEAKNPSILFKAPGLIDAIQQYVQTDLTPEQQLALASLFHKVQPANIQTASLPTEGTDTIDGINYVIPDEYGKSAAVDWILRGNRDAMNRLIRVELKNASGDRELYGKVYDCLRHYGFEVVRAGRAEGDPKPATRAVQLSSMKGAARRVLEVLGIRSDVTKEEGDPWGPDVTLYVGQDLAENQTVTLTELWPDLPERPARSRRQRVVRARRDNGTVRVRSVEPDSASEEKPEEKPEETHMDVPGTADPASAPEPANSTTPTPAPTSAPAPDGDTSSTPPATPGTSSGE